MQSELSSYISPKSENIEKKEKKNKESKFLKTQKINYLVLQTQICKDTFHIGC
jgi:hypothetical protein